MADNLPLHPCRGLRLEELTTALFAYWRMIALLIKDHVGLIHIHVASRASVWRKSIFAFTAILFRVPYVLHMHGAEFEEFFRRECGPLRRKKRPYSFFRNAATVIALSESWAAKLREMAPGTRVEVVYNSVSLPRRKTFGHNEVRNGIFFSDGWTRRLST